LNLADSFGQAIIRSVVSVTRAAIFLELLPKIRRQARVAFRGFGSEARDEMAQEVVANAYRAFVQLVRRGRADLAYATPLAQFAIRQVRCGRRIGNQLS
jgi:hypothetical protein